MLLRGSKRDDAFVICAAILIPLTPHKMRDNISNLKPNVNIFFDYSIIITEMGFKAQKQCLK